VVGDHRRADRPDGGGEGWVTTEGRIDIGVAVEERVAMFATRRSLAGPAGEHFDVGEAEAAGASLPASLARRCFQVDPDVAWVHVLTQDLIIERPMGWDEGSLRRMVEAIRAFLDAEGSSAEDVEELRRRHYNATISEVREVHEELRIIRVRPDHPLPPFEAGQYTTLALGYWEPRVEHREDLDPRRGGRLARRSYSVSSSIVDGDGNLLEPQEALEFYVVLVRGEADPRDLPALTPRLFLKGEGDRLYMSTRFLGGYTLKQVEPDHDVVFLATGTGEAPHNLMTLELLRGGHRGRILSVCCVRYRRDLGYLARHRRLEELFPTYRYLSLTTREREDSAKVYIQDLIRSGRLEEELGSPLDPDRSHVFLCGNPAMIGLPGRDGSFPEPQGAVELLAERGFTLDDNIHYEEYWKQKTD
jgi:ferredoxin--NADP+ reductase